MRERAEDVAEVVEGPESNPQYCQKDERWGTGEPKEHDKPLDLNEICRALSAAYAFSGAHETFPERCHRWDHIDF
jgi:hypothetical protein